MPVIERSAIVTFSPAQMFDLVNDVDRYPEFLPWCAAAQVAADSDGERLASITVARGVLRAQFTTRNTLTRHSRIGMHLVQGPFRDLTGEWRFEPIGDRGARIAFRVQFEFNNRLTALALGATFEAVCGTLVDAFVARAQDLYARPGA